MGSKTFIQWKGTDVCMDIWCPACNKANHYDGYFAYQVKCSGCGTVYELGSEVSLKKVEGEDINAPLESVTSEFTL